MAVYSIKNWLEALTSLRAELRHAVNDMSDASDRLMNNISGIEDELGIYYEYIRLENEKVLLTLRKAFSEDDGVGYLINNKIPQMISYMKMLIDARLGDDEPEEKRLSIHR